jgi:hypothetical protein
MDGAAEGVGAMLRRAAGLPRLRRADISRQRVRIVLVLNPGGLARIASVTVHHDEHKVDASSDLSTNGTLRSHGSPDPKSAIQDSLLPDWATQDECAFVSEGWSSSDRKDQCDGETANQ